MRTLRFSLVQGKTLKLKTAKQAAIQTEDRETASKQAAAQQDTAGLQQQKVQADIDIRQQEFDLKKQIDEQQAQAELAERRALAEERRAKVRKLDSESDKLDIETERARDPMAEVKVNV